MIDLNELRKASLCLRIELPGDVANDYLNRILPALDELESLRKQVAEKDAEIERLNRQLDVIFRSMTDMQNAILADNAPTSTGYAHKRAMAAIAAIHEELATLRQLAERMRDAATYFIHRSTIDNQAVLSVAISEYDRYRQLNSREAT